MSKINLFCFPFAGGDFYSYKAMAALSPPELCLKTVELPGRGRKVNQPLISNIHQLANVAYQQILPALSAPYAFYGHSMGALLGYLVARLIVENGQIPPVYLCFTGARGPSIARREPMRYLMTDEELKNELRTLGGISDEVLENKPLMDFYNAILRSDFQAVETYAHVPAKPFAIPMTVIVGTKEKVTYEEASAWQKETTQPVKVLQFPGDHFFILKWPGEIIKRIHADLQAHLNTSILLS